MEKINEGVLSNVLTAANFADDAIRTGRNLKNRHNLKKQLKNTNDKDKKKQLKKQIRKQTGKAFLHGAMTGLDIALREEDENMNDYIKAIRVKQARKKLLDEDYYSDINDQSITDVFSNFEDKYGKDDTTELTTFKDLKQRDAFPPHGKTRPNMFKKIHDRDMDANKGSFYDKMEYLKEAYNQGYMEGLASNAKQIAKDHPVGTARALMIGIPTAVAGYGLYKANKLANDMNYREKYFKKKQAKDLKRYQKYKRNGGKLSYEDYNNPKKRSYEMYQRSGGTLSYDDWKNHRTKLQAEKEKADREVLEKRERLAKINAMEAQARKDNEAAATMFNKRYSKK